MQTFQTKEIPRVSVNDFSPNQHYFHTRNEKTSTSTFQYETPVIVENALPPSVCENFCDIIASALGSTEIQVQRKQRTMKTTNTKNDDPIVTLYDCTLHQAFDLMMQSSHDDAIFAFCEGLLDTIPMSNPPPIEKDDPNDIVSQMQQILYETQESIFQTNHDPPDPDWFSYFPPDIQPTDCVILAGEGAASTLHRDPFEWTGTSLCLEGTKIWRFLPPPLYTNQPPTQPNRNEKEVQEGDFSGVPIMDDILDSYRLNSIAWSDDDNDHLDQDTPSIPLSAGWQSDKSLFAKRSKEIPSAHMLSQMEESEKCQYLEQIAKDPNQLQSNIHNNSNDGNTRSEDVNMIWTTVQKPGDLLIIPAYWYHQTYALEPSLAIASQRCGAERDAHRVFQHILKVSGMAENSQVMKGLLKDLPPIETGMEPEEYVTVFFRHFKIFMNLQTTDNS